ncbi:MAG: BrnT family toxin [Candidatus Omnitrophota bacterium]|nr:BrnT family toxin [Candidatus Omnitrophota bacterium]
MLKEYGSFVWDPRKEKVNIHKHRIDFITAAKAFKDSKRKIFIDSRHSENEKRYFCIGKAGNRIVTIRFTYRSGKIRMIGAGCWRKGIKYYEET